MVQNWRFCTLTVGAKAEDTYVPRRGRHAELGHVLLLVNRSGDDLSTQLLKTGHAMLHAKHVQRRAAGEEQTRVPMTPAQGTDGSLNTETHRRRQTTSVISHQSVLKCPVEDELSCNEHIGSQKKESSLNQRQTSAVDASCLYRSTRQKHSFLQRMHHLMLFIMICRNPEHCVAYNKDALVLLHEQS